MFKRIRIGFAVIAAATAVTGTAGALITATADEVHVGSPPASVALNQHEHDDDTGNPRGAHAFDEEQSYVTTAPIVLDNCSTATSAFVTCPTPKAGRIRDTVDMRGGVIPAGTCIDSHFIHADPPGTPVGGVVYDGTVTFDSPILGVIVTTSSLIASDLDPGLAPSPVVYDATPTRGLELDTEADEFTINTSANRIVFTFDVRVTMDQMRVITLGDADSCPGQAAELTLSPKAATNEVGTEHCVTASVKTETGGPAAGVVVRFDVEGASETDGHPTNEDDSVTTGQDGLAVHCYDGPETVGVDTIHAYADNDEDGQQDVPTDPSDDATKAWTAAQAETLTLEPKATENPVDTEHCVTATVRDVFLNPVPDESVEFRVIGTATRQGSDLTDEDGVAVFCYTSQTAGADDIFAFVDEDSDETADVGEPADTAVKVWQPGDPATLTLDPKAASNRVQEEHCVTATVRDAFQNPVPDTVVRFTVAGVNTRVGSDETDEGGQAEFCYVGGTQAGADTINAYADNDGDGEQGPDETAADTAAKTWLPLEPAVLNLTPEADQNIVNEQHCLQAHVTDVFGNPNPDETVYFVVTGTVEKQASDTTDEGGIAEWCYTSTTAGTDTIHAFVDSVEENGTQDPGEPFDDAVKVWHPGDPAQIDVNPKASTNEVGTQHCVKAQVKDAFGNPTPDETVVFDVEGASETDTDPADEDGTDQTDEFGSAEHCYTGPDLPGADTILVYADNDEDGTHDAGEPGETVAKTWVIPATTPGCEITITNGGWITTTTGSKGTFGGNAMAEVDGTVRGQEQYVDHGAVPIDFHSIEILAVVCNNDRADVYGTGRLNGVPTDFRIRVRDAGEPSGRGDTYQIITGAYVSGPEDNPLLGGNVQIRRFS